MATASIKRDRRANKEVLRVVDRIVEYPSHFESLCATGRTVCSSYEGARGLKAEFDEMGRLINKRAIIVPLVAGGWEVRTTHDDPREKLGRVSKDVLALVIAAEEEGTTVHELMTWNPGRVATSSGNAGQRVNHANAVAEAGYRQSLAAQWAESVWIKGKGWS